MPKLYSVKEITDVLNRELEDTDVDYRYTEERVRARLRYAQSKRLITPKTMGYDRRAKYYTEEDVEKLRTSWIGPMLPEFEAYKEDIEALDTEHEEIEVRPAKEGDAEAISNLLPIKDYARGEFTIYLSKMLKGTKTGNFVALYNSEEIIGWSQAEVSPALSALEGEITGVIRIYVPAERKDRSIAARSLTYRAEWWLRNLNVSQVVIEVPDAMFDLRTLFTDTLLFEPEQRVMLLKKPTK